MKKLMWSLIAICIVVLVSACAAEEAVTPAPSNNQGTTNAPNTSQNKEQKPQPEEKLEPIELFMYYPYPADWPEDVFRETYAEPIQEQFPHITIKYLPGGSIPEMLTIKQPIDILWASTGATPNFLNANELEFDISELINKYDYDLSRFDPHILEAGQKFANGGLYGLPIYVPPSTMYYNKALFDQFGVEYPTDDMTWDEVYDINQRLTRTEDGVSYVGIALSYGHMALLNQWSIPIVNEETMRSTFDTDERWKPWMETFVRFYDNYDNNPSRMSEPHERRRFFQDRTAAMFFALTALEPEENMIDLDWDVASFPSFADRPGVGPQPYPNYFQITSMSEHKDAAFQVIAFLASDEYQMRWSRAGRMLTTLKDPAFREAFGADNPFYQGKNVKAFWPKSYAPVGPQTIYNNQGNGYFTPAMRSVILGEKDINTALREAAETYNQFIIEREAARN